MSNSNVPEHATRTRRVTADLLHGGNRAPIERQDLNETAFTAPAPKRAMAPRAMTVQILDPKTLQSQKNDRDMTDARKLTDRECADREKAAKQARKAQRAQAQTLQKEADKLLVSAQPRPKVLPAYRVQLTDGNVSNPIPVDPEVSGFLPAIKAHATDLADRVSNFRAEHGVFLVVYRTVHDGPQTFMKVEIHYYAKAGAATIAGEKEVAEGADRFTVSPRLTRAELLQSERGPARDPFKRIPNVWVNRTHKQTWGFGETRCKQTKASFSWG